MKTPKTLGSKAVGEDLAGMGIASCNGVASRTIARIRRHRIHHEKAMPAMPHPQAINRTEVTKRWAGDAGAEAGAETVEAAKGWLNSIATKESVDCDIGEGARHAS